MLDIKRREFIALVGGGGLLLTAKVPRARPQQQSMPVVGFLEPRSPHVIANLRRAFHQGLKETGHAEGENVVIEYLCAENANDRLPASPAHLVRRHVALI